MRNPSSLKPALGAAVALALWLPAASFAAPPAPAVAELPPVLSEQAARGVTVHSSFETGTVLTGYTVELQNEQHIVYVTPDGNHMVLGVMLDSQGRNVTEQHRETHLSGEDFEESFAKLESSAWVSEGSGEAGREGVYVFMEPNCGFCHLFWRAAKHYIAEGAQMRHVPVAFLREDSLGKSAAILEAEDPESVTIAHQRAFSKGGIAPADTPKVSSIQAINENNNLMREFGSTGTPTIVFRDASGAIQVIKGMPSLDQVAMIFDMDKIEINDPDLTRFDR
ncbi:thiol:disulfide interchange protein DsbG [Thioalkalivibrio thiocyanodenitrificans]|uniref:thiol:disulfide interchange protein DsbG n=1 Tax=Thioalkalivibrio thiocyanodenitrificans TaxID=243063 RepID=UPI0003773D6C|nr:thiol:disulfide interchange protein DsbG [Thioalkalivibrio thiocyanodenitrificans]